MRALALSSDGLLFDRMLVGVFLVAAEVELVFDSRRTNPLIFDALALEFSCWPWSGVARIRWP